jgi:signal transduction histidine kinase
MICLIVLLPSALLADSSSGQHSVAGLEQRLESIDQELEQLARSNMRSGVGSIGYESQLHPDPHHTEWVQVELQRPTPIDQIVIVPTIWHDSSSGFSAGGFPREFQILAGLGPTAEGTVIASFSEEDALLPRSAPLVIPCATTASWVRVQASVLSKRSLDEHYNLQLSELLVFDGQDNVALHRAVTSSSVGNQESTSRDRTFLTDGFLPYKMDAGHGKKGVSFQSNHEPGDQPSITIDLGTAYPINRIQLHSQDTGQTAPMAIPEGLGLPSRLVVEGANQADFSDAVELVQYHKKSIYDVGPIVMLNFPETQCRYVRLTALKLTNVAGFPLLMGFAEIELIANGQNVARDKPATVTPFLSKRREVALTDGGSTYGRILPLRQWMEQLARRHELESIRPVLAAELQDLYEAQKERLRYLSWVIVILVGAVVMIILIDRLLHLRQAAHLKERFAADLHDELGANLHTIVLLGDVATKKSNALPENITGLIQRMQATAKRSVFAVEHVTDLQSAGRICKNLPVDMRRAAERIVVELKHDFNVEGEEHLARVHPRDQVNLFLFYKECLINSCRHSGATVIMTRLVIRARSLELSVTDNGSGLYNEGDAEDGDGGQVPLSVQRRAKILGARVTRSTPPGGGSCITLNMRTWNHWLRRR